MYRHEVVEAAILGLHEGIEVWMLGAKLAADTSHQVLKVLTCARRLCGDQLADDPEKLLLDGGGSGVRGATKRKDLRDLTASRCAKLKEMRVTLQVADELRSLDCVHEPQGRLELFAQIVDADTSRRDCIVHLGQRCACRRPRRHPARHQPGCACYTCEVSQVLTTLVWLDLTHSRVKRRDEARRVVIQQAHAGHLEQHTLEPTALLDHTAQRLAIFALVQLYRDLRGENRSAFSKSFA
mmetsp:Transcript_8996/g.19583  ORF Transcript_8996/g.19583 Transcript_8996/m.19583 type:complete len:239 (+) Transcript_8996:1789-2505(+)